MELTALAIISVFLLMLAGLIFLVVKGFKKMYDETDPCGECGGKLDHEETCVYFHDQGYSC